MQFNFRIVSVKAGWFDAEISNESASVVITNSYYLGNDAPRILLRNLCEMALLEEQTRYLCWHDEPGAYLIMLQKVNTIMEYSVSLAAKESHKLCFEGVGLSNEAIDKEMISGNIPFRRFFKTVASAFSEYSTGNKMTMYENEWGGFPFDDLKKAQSMIARLK